MPTECEPAAVLPNIAATGDPSAPSVPPVGTHGNYHRLILAIAAGIVLVACVLQVRSDQRVAVSPFSRWPLPEVCQSKVLFGVDCPGCGLTRSFVHLAHGNIPASLAVHPLGWLVALFVLAQFPYRIWALKTRSAAPLGERTPWIITGVLFALLLAVWIARLAL